MFNGFNLKKLKYIWNYFLGDFSYYHRLKKPLNKPDVFAIELTSQCNLRCVMCPHPVMQRAKFNMGFDIFRKIVDNVEPYAFFIWLHSLGEPLLNPRVGEMIKYCKERGIKVGLSTNATVLNETNGRKLIEAGLDKIILCMESTEKETYEKIRVGGKFESVKNNIRRFLELKKELNSDRPYTVVQIIQMKETQAQIEAFRKEWEPLCDEVLVKVFSTWANQVSEIPVLSEREHRYHKQLKKRQPCQLLWRNIVILSDGKVSPCCIDYEGKINLGNAAETPLPQIWNGEPMQKLRELHLTEDYQAAPVCDGCEEWLGGEEGKLYPFDSRFLQKLKNLVHKQKEENVAF